MQTATSLSTRRPPGFLAGLFGALGGAFGRTNKPHEKLLILGGTKSGKSHCARIQAERLLSRYPSVIQIGSENSDKDAAASDLPAILRKATEPVVIDCLGVWLNQLLGELGAWKHRKGWESHLDDCLKDLVLAWQETSVPIIAVSNETGSGMTPPTEFERLFRDVLGALNLQVSLESDRVLFMIAGRALPLA